MRRNWKHTVIAIALAGASLTAFAAGERGYLIILKNGGKVEAKAKPEQKGANLIFQTPLGTTQMLKASEVDLEKTEAHNKAGLGNAYEIDSPKQQQLDVPERRSTGIADQLKGIPRISTPTPEPRAADAVSGSTGTTSSRGGKTPDPAATPQLETGTNDIFSRAMDTSNVRGARLAPMPPSGVKISAITENEQQVFAAIGAIARGLKEARAQGKNVERVEITLATPANEPAGKFLMSADDAEALLTGKISAPKYFVASVVF